MPASPLKVLFLPKWYPDRNDPQIGVFIRKHAEAVALYCDVRVLRIAPLTEMRERFLIEEMNGSVPELFVYYKPSASSIGWIRKTVNFLRYYKAFNKGWRTLKKQKWAPDIIHVHVMTRPGFMAYWKKYMWNLPYVISEHSSEYLTGKFGAKSGMYKALNFRIFWRAAAITAVSEHLADGMKKVGLPGEIAVVPNVVDLPETLPGKETDGVYHVLTVADLVDDIKNISGILRAVARLVAKGIDMEYHLVGGGPDEEQLKALSDSLGIEDKVHFYGRLDNQQAMERMAKADLVVINSRVETFALVVAEAIGSGTPVVATKCGGPEAFVNSTTGLLVKVDNEDDLAAGIESVLKGLSDYDATKMRESLGNKYDRESIGKQFFDIYKGILRKN